MKLSIDGVGVVGGFGFGLTNLETVLQNQKTLPQQAFFEMAGEKINIPAYLADTGPIETFIQKKALRRVDHFSKMAALGAFLALKDAGVPAIDHQRVGLVVASGYGATRTTFSFLDSVNQNGDAFASPTLFSNSVHNAAAGHISILLKLSGPSLTVSQFEMSVPSALISAIQWLEDERVDHVLLGAVDEYCEVLGYCRHRFFENSPEGPPDFNRQCPPPGEGAAFFLLSRANGKPAPYGYLTDVKMGNLGETPLPLRKDAKLIIGADGHACAKDRYEPLVGDKHEVFSYVPLYGSLPVGQAFDLAIASLSMKNKILYATPDAKSYSGKMRFAKTEKKSDTGFLSCLKLGPAGDFGIINLTSE